jgi:hypothetical protein
MNDPGDRLTKRGDARGTPQRQDHQEGTNQEGTNDETHLEGVAMLRRLVHVLLVVALGTALATAALTAPAVAQEPPTITARLTGNATLVAKGAAVDVEVAYSCSPDTTSATIGVELTQRVSSGQLATGFGFTSDLVCDGAEHTTTVRVVAEGGNAFKKGSAVAEVDLVACNEFTCVFSGLSPGTVRIR